MGSFVLWEVVRRTRSMLLWQDGRHLIEYVWYWPSVSLNNADSFTLCTNKNCWCRCVAKSSQLKAPLLSCDSRRSRTERRRVLRFEDGVIVGRTDSTKSCWKCCRRFLVNFKSVFQLAVSALCFWVLDLVAFLVQSFLVRGPEQEDRTASLVGVLCPDWTKWAGIPENAFFFPSFYCMSKRRDVLLTTHSVTVMPVGIQSCIIIWMKNYTYSSLKHPSRRVWRCI